VARRPRVIRVWLLRALVLAGVVAMHVLAGGTHAAHATAHPAVGGAATAADRPGIAVLVAAAPAVEPSALTTVEQHLRHTMGDVTAGASAVSRIDVPAPGVDTPSTVACLAVLLSAVLILTLPRHLGSTAQRPRAASLPWQRTARPSRAPPRDLLAQLCVLRT
jgi:hypothetical protein